MAKGTAFTCLLVLLLAQARGNLDTINNILFDKFFRTTTTTRPTTFARLTTPATYYGLPASGRIIGGSRVYDRCVEPFNAMVAIQLLPNDPLLRLTFCSGVLIAPDTIATAAVCVYPYLNFDISVVTVITGDKLVDQVDSNQQNFQVTNADFRVHPYYDNIAGDNNIALIKLPQPVTVTSCVKPLPRYSSYNPSQCPNSFMNCTITGWGAGDPTSNLVLNSKYPLYGHINVVSETLSRIMAGSSRYPTAQLRQNSLFGIPHSGSYIQACLLDWGGMAACQVNGQWQLRGIIAEHDCADGSSSNSGKLMVLSDVEKFASWIDSCIGNWGSCPRKTL